MLCHLRLQRPLALRPSMFWLVLSISVKKLTAWTRLAMLSFWWALKKVMVTCSNHLHVIRMLCKAHWCLPKLLATTLHVAWLSSMVYKKSGRSMVSHTKSPRPLKCQVLAVKRRWQNWWASCVMNTWPKLMVTRYSRFKTSWRKKLLKMVR